MYDKEISGRIKSYDFWVKLSLLIVSLATLALLSVAAYLENFLPDWRRAQLAYREILFAKAKDAGDTKLAQDFAIELRQLVVPELKAVDRCISCHTGIDDPRMTDQVQPFKTHPGDYLATHEPARFGCTSCHQGQGRATEIAAAHGRVPHWDRPMIEKSFLGSTCGRCHNESDLFGDGGEFFAGKWQTGEIHQSALAGVVPGQQLVSRGKQLFRQKGCLGCHSYRGKGGTLGPDLTFVGDKTRHDFDFSRFDRDEPRTVEYWLEKHFLEPQEITPGTLMPPLELEKNDVTALTAYVLSLKRKSIPPSHRPPPTVLVAKPAGGEELFSLACSACHGKDGRQSEVPGLRTPALNNADFLAVAGDDYLRAIIANGRSGTKMPAWRPGFSYSEIDRLVEHIRSWEPAPPDLRAISSQRGSERRGRALFAGNCGNCHGDQGQGGIGNTLNSATFLAVASDAFLARTIVSGRAGTAMPSWKEFSEQEVSDILSYIRSWHRRPHDKERVLSLSQARGKRDSVGQLTYRAYCASCHGAQGEGGIGVTLNSQDFLIRASREYLYEAITEGRPGTAMPTWTHLADEQIAGLIAHLKSWQNRPDIAEERSLGKGDWRLGEVTYGLACAGCHGSRGQGGSAPQIANPAFLRSASDTMLFDWVAHGRVGTAMKGFLPEAQGVVSLTESQILDTIAYLRYVGLSGEPLPPRQGVGDWRHGGELYVGTCAPCHGVHGEGASGPQLNNATFLDTASDGFLMATIVLGRTGTPMRSMVHGQEGLGQVSPDDVDDLVAFIRRWSFPGTWRIPRPSVEMTGEAIQSGGLAFGENCSGCHGPSGKGEADGADYFAPALNNPEFLRAASDGFLLATIARGRRGTPMRPFGKGAGGIAELSTDEISNIVSFIRSWDSEYWEASSLAAHINSEREVPEGD